MRNVGEHNLREALEPASPALSFLFSDFPLHRKDVEGMIKNIDTPIFAAGEAVSEPGVIHLFDSQEAFDSWARLTRFARKFDQIAKIIERTHGKVMLNSHAVQLVSNVPVERQWPVAHSSADLDTPVSATFYEQEDFGGRVFSTEAAAIADLADIEFSMQAASMRVSGVCLLTSETGFHGARLYLVGDPEVRVPRLHDWGFSKRAASAIII
jgi:hypothetical protein